MCWTPLPPRDRAFMLIICAGGFLHLKEFRFRLRESMIWVYENNTGNFSLTDASAAAVSSVKSV